MSLYPVFASGLITSTREMTFSWSKKPRQELNRIKAVRIRRSFISRKILFASTRSSKAFGIYFIRGCEFTMAYFLYCDFSARLSIKSRAHNTISSMSNLFDKFILIINNKSGSFRILGRKWNIGIPEHVKACLPFGTTILVFSSAVFSMFA